MRQSRMRRVGLNALGLMVFAVMIFPVYWMVSTAFKPDDEVYSLTPRWLPLRTPPALPVLRTQRHRASAGRARPPTRPAVRGAARAGRDNHGRAGFGL